MNTYFAFCSCRIIIAKSHKIILSTWYHLIYFILFSPQNMDKSEPNNTSYPLFSVPGTLFFEIFFCVCSGCFNPAFFIQRDREYPEHRFPFLIQCTYQDKISDRGPVISAIIPYVRASAFFFERDLSTAFFQRLHIKELSFFLKRISCGQDLCFREHFPYCGNGVFGVPRLFIQEHDIPVKHLIKVIGAVCTFFEEESQDILGELQVEHVSNIDIQICSQGIKGSIGC